MLALLVLWVATLGRELAILAPYAAAILLVTTVTTVTTVAALVVRWLSGRRVRRRQAERTRAALAELFAAMGAKMDAAMASVRAALAAMPPERYAALSWADRDETPRHPAGCPMTPESDRV